MIIATFSLPADAIALEHTFREVPELRVEAERIAAHSTAWTMPCLWAANAEFDTVDEALANDPSVDEIVEMDEFDGEKYYQLDWGRSVEERINSYLDKEASLMKATANADGWRVRMRFATREQFDAFREHLEARGRSFRLEQLTEPGASRRAFGNLTSTQRDALVAAKERGYYRVPRETTARELAEELDMTHQSVSELLRRGTANLIGATLGTEEELSDSDT